MRRPVSKSRLQRHVRPFVFKRNAQNRLLRSQGYRAHYTFFGKNQGGCDRREKEKIRGLRSFGDCVMVIRDVHGSINYYTFRVR